MKKHIVCFGDSNTHGYCADPKDCADGGDRFNEQERWTCLLQEKLGDEYLVLEEGLSGRTTVFRDPLNECMSGLDVIYSCLRTHEPVDLLIIMLGTNDTKERFGANAECIAAGLERLVRKAKTVDCWKREPNILVIAPPPMHEGPTFPEMGNGFVEKSRLLARQYALKAELTGCAFLDAGSVTEFNRVDQMHLTKEGHRQLAGKLAELVPQLLS